MTLALDRQQQRQVVEQVRRANQVALDHPALQARYLDANWAIRAHTEHISRHLRDLAHGRLRRLLVVTPPQVGKSTLISEWMPYWWLCRNPRNRVIIASYGSQLAVKRGRTIRRLVQEHGWRWGLALEYGAASMVDWALTQHGGVKSVGIGSGVTGSPGDLAIVDDPHKSRAEAESVRHRDNVWDWWSADLLSRLSPGAPVVMVLTRWHVDDLAGRVLAQDGHEDEGGLWRVVRMPAFADDPNDPLGRPIGAPLPHPKIDPDDTAAAQAHWEDKRASSSVRDWYALYMCDPKPVEGALVTADLLRARRHQPCPATPVKHAVAVDPSGGGRDLAGVIGGHLGDDGRLYLTHDRSKTGYSDTWAMEAAILAAELGAEFIVMEKNYGGDMARMVMRSAWDTMRRLASGDTRPEDDPALVARCAELQPGMMPQIRLVTAKKGKLLRAEPIAQQWHDDRLRTAAYLPDLEGEWQTWQPTDPLSPGRIDASCYLAFELLPIPGAEAVVSSPVGVRRNSVAGRHTFGRPRIERPGY